MINKVLNLSDVLKISFQDTIAYFLNKRNFSFLIQMFFTALRYLSHG